MKNIFVFLLVLSFVLSPVRVSFAASTTADTETLQSMIDAIRAYLARAQGRNTAPLTPRELRVSIGAGAEWLKNAQEESGHFRYEYRPYENTYSGDDNIVRQAGALYALGEILRRSEGDSLEVGRAMKRSIAYFTSLTREDDSGEETFSCIAKNETSMRCPLGATALALVGIISYVEAYPKEAKTYEPLIDAYRTYILTMQKANGGFRDLHSVESGRLNSAESAFSNGEALLALVRVYAYEQNDEVKDAILRAFNYLKAQPYDSNLYLWIMAATRDMHALWPHEEYTEYARSFTLWRIEEAKRLTDRTRNYCAYSEGVASAASMLEDTLTGTEWVRVSTELNARNRNHHALQLTENDTVRLVMKNGVPIFGTLETPRQALGGFLTGDGEPSQRIDFTQHCITGYVQTLVDVLGDNLES